MANCDQVEICHFREVAWSFPLQVTTSAMLKLCLPARCGAPSKGAGQNSCRLIYLNLQTGIEPALDEFDFGNLSRRTLVEYAQRFPSTVYKHLLPALATETFAP
jgi:hypothetical protein